jgi:hypothetical protein
VRTARPIPYLTLATEGEAERQDMMTDEGNLEFGWEWDDETRPKPTRLVDWLAPIAREALAIDARIRDTTNWPRQQLVVALTAVGLFDYWGEEDDDVYPVGWLAAVVRGIRERLAGDYDDETFWTEVRAEVLAISRQ